MTVTTIATVLAVLVAAPLVAVAQSESAAPSAVREGHLTADDGARLYYRVVGSGQPVVIIPGGLFLERAFARLARGRTVVLYDMRGRGRSDPVAEAASPFSTRSATSRPSGATSAPSESRWSGGPSSACWSCATRRSIRAA